MSRSDAERVVRDLVGGGVPEEGDTIVFTEKGWRLKSTLSSDSYAPFAHNHDGRYYTKSEIDALLANRLPYITANITWDPPDVPAGDWVAEIFAVDGAREHDALFVENPWLGVAPFIIMQFKVIDDDTVRLALYNESAILQSLAESTVRIVAAKIP